MVFSEPELAYLSEQRLGRLATVDATGRPQANPTGFFVRDDGTVDIGASNPYVSLVADDLAGVRPRRVRGMEIRGKAEQVTDPTSAGRS